LNHAGFYAFQVLAISGLLNSRSEKLLQAHGWIIFAGVTGFAAGLGGEVIRNLHFFSVF
jgi:hypothetical protein